MIRPQKGGHIRAILRVLPCGLKKPIEPLRSVPIGLGKNISTAKQFDKSIAKLSPKCPINLNPPTPRVKTAKNHDYTNIQKPACIQTHAVAKAQKDALARKERRENHKHWHENKH